MEEPCLPLKLIHAQFLHFQRRATSLFGGRNKLTRLFSEKKVHSILGCKRIIYCLARAMTLKFTDSGLRATNS